MAKDLSPLKMTDDLKLVVKACFFFYIYIYISLLPLKMTDDLKLVAKACFFFFFNDISPYSRTFQV